MEEVAYLIDEEDSIKEEITAIKVKIEVDLNLAIEVEDKIVIKIA